MPLAPDPPFSGSASKSEIGAGQGRRRRRGRISNRSGLAAEEAVARHYARQGARILARRHRTPSGELDLVVTLDDTLVFVEVKQRKSRQLQDSPVSEAQWRRLACAAQEFMIEDDNVTRTLPYCRFDVAIVGPDGTMQIIENARMFE